MRQFDVVNTIVDIVFSGKTTGNYVESQRHLTANRKFILFMEVHYVIT